MPKHVILAMGEMPTNGRGWTKPENLICNGPQTQVLALQRPHRSRAQPRYWDIGNVQLNGIRFLPIVNSYTETRMFYDGQMHVTYKVPPELVAYSQEHYPNEFP